MFSAKFVLLLAAIWLIFAGQAASQLSTVAPSASAVPDVGKTLNELTQPLSRLMAGGRQPTLVDLADLVNSLPDVVQATNFDSSKACRSYCWTDNCQHSD